MLRVLSLPVLASVAAAQLERWRGLMPIPSRNGLSFKYLHVLADAYYVGVGGQRRSTV